MTGLTAMSSAMVGKLGQGWDIDNVIGGSLQTVGVALQETDPFGAYVSPNGQYLFICGGDSNEVHRYEMSTAFDVTTAVHDQTSTLNVANTDPHGVFFSPDGLQMFICDRTAIDVFRYSLSTAWQISSGLTLLQDFDMPGTMAEPIGICLSEDGKHLYVVDLDIGGASESIDHWVLATPWVLPPDATASDDAFDTTLTDAFPVGVCIKRDGSKLYFTGSDNDSIYELTLPTPFALVGETVTGTFDFGITTALPRGVSLQMQNGLRLFVMDGTNDQMLQYDLPIEVA